MTAMLKQFQSNPPPAQPQATTIRVIQYRPQGVANQMRPPGFAQPNVQNNQNRFGQPQGFNRSQNFNQEQPYQATTQSNQNFHLNELGKIKRMNDVSLKAMQNQIDMVKNKLRNEMKTSIQTSLSNQTNEIKNMMASLLQMNTASTSGLGTLAGNTIANPKGELKAITIRSGLVTDGPTVHNPPKSVNPEEDECVEKTYTDPDLAEYTIKVPPPPPVQKPKPPVQRNFVLHTRDSLPPHIPYPSIMLKQKQQEKYDIQIQKLWNMFKQLHLNITLAEALVLMPKYQKMLKALLYNKEKLYELANTPLNKNCSVVILKKLPEKLEDPGKFLIPCSFSELKCKALADLGASINLMPLSVRKKLGLPDLIPTRMTLELANRAICTPDGIARDVFVSVGKFTFLADFVIVDYESDPRVPLILGRPFLRTACALIDVFGEEMILRDGDERLTLNMKHDTASYSNHPHRELVNLIISSIFQ
nr:reverse transcriptase domain-containing protein [Tanacetum cinerariifolium]